MSTLKERAHQTRCGTIRYWVDIVTPDAYTLVFLPGLTADHRLFDRQIKYFEGKYNVLVWDAPAHASSWPFRFDFNLFDQAKWLNEIFSRENICRPVIVGQSMGGYVGQAYAQLFPDKLAGFISIDSAPLAKKYVTAVERWLLKKNGARVCALSVESAFERRHGRRRHVRVWAASDARNDAGLRRRSKALCANCRTRLSYSRGCNGKGFAV